MKTKMICNCCGSKKIENKIAMVGKNIRVISKCKECGKIVAITE